MLWYNKNVTLQPVHRCMPCGMVYHISTCCAK